MGFEEYRMAYFAPSGGLDLRDVLLRSMPSDGQIIETSDTTWDIVFPESILQIDFEEAKLIFRVALCNPDTVEERVLYCLKTLLDEVGGHASYHLNDGLPRFEVLDASAQAKITTDLRRERGFWFKQYGSKDRWKATSSQAMKAWMDKYHPTTGGE